jgi:hypothetical protein
MIQYFILFQLEEERRFIFMMAHHGSVNPMRTGHESYFVLSVLSE